MGKRSKQTFIAKTYLKADVDFQQKIRQLLSSCSRQLFCLFIFLLPFVRSCLQKKNTLKKYVWLHFFYYWLTFINFFESYFNLWFVHNLKLFTISFEKDNFSKKFLVKVVRLLYLYATIFNFIRYLHSIDIFFCLFSIKSNF